MSATSPLTTVASIDLPRYLGTWYEIDRLPMRHEPEAATDISAHYSLNPDGSIRVQNRCIDNGGMEESIGQATAVDSTNSKLEVTFLPEGLRWIPFTKGDYWILKIDEAYTCALVGSPDRKYLWLLSRQPQMDPATRQHYIAYAAQLGFAVDRLIHTPHTGHSTA
ncbi:lipocalin family protein [Stenotrophomonas sp. YIM B06876]|uniref:lipocalin family protein n=1 Tax=Stenotrophomonas sp. YIM B06876 TaxID=3060211 RepID=UPI00273829AC|nr:lipocalin family protein [Stenotrophomonas sp. YIM B06876]